MIGTPHKELHMLSPYLEYNEFEPGEVQKGDMQNLLGWMKFGWSANEEQRRERRGPLLCGFFSPDQPRNGHQHGRNLRRPNK